MKRDILNRQTIQNFIEIVVDRRQITEESSEPTMKEFVTIRLGNEDLFAGPLKTESKVSVYPEPQEKTVPVAQLDMISTSSILTTDMYKEAFDTVKNMTGHSVALRITRNENIKPLDNQNMVCIIKRAATALAL